MRRAPSLLFPVLLLGLPGCPSTPATMTLSMDMAQPPAQLAVCTAMLPPNTVASTMTGAMSSAGDVASSGACTEASTDITRSSVTDIAPAGLTVLGDAIEFTGFAGPYPHGIDFMIPADLGKGPAGAPETRIVVVEKRATGLVLVSNVSNVLYEDAYKRLHFHAAELGTYQAAIPQDAGQKRMRHFNYRAVGGVSMGGNGSTLNFWMHPDRYDGIAVMGADPGPDMTYTVGVLNDWFFGGFCTVADEKAGTGKLGALCPSPRQPMLDQHERPMDFEHMPAQNGAGIGLNPDRPFFLKAFRDVTRAYGNAAYPTVAGDTTQSASYLPPAVPASSLLEANVDQCGKPVVLKNYFDYRFNPDGKRDVITFCDGGYVDDTHKGDFDGSATAQQTIPTQIILAVDVNGDRKRNSGEPVLVQGSEHYYDDGVDGIPDALEPGYDAVTNPDPNHDDFHWLNNPSGTEKNWRFDDGEKFDDFGVDGVQGQGCTVGSKAPVVNGDGSITGCYDYGEGNGKFDMTPNALNFYAHDPHSHVLGYLGIPAVSDAQLDDLDIYYDTGIRDFFNNGASTNALFGALQTRGQYTRVWEGFTAMQNVPASAEQKFNDDNLDFDHQLGRHALVHYGDVDAKEADVEVTGDGRHVGSVLQAVHRGQVMFYALSHMWPGGDVETDVSGGEEIDTMFTDSHGRVTPYTVVTPPGYNDPQNKDKTYPAVYLGHGLGMMPSGLAGFAIVAHSAMVNAEIPAERRMQKMLVVVADAYCRPGGSVEDGPIVPLGGDLCEEGAYYTDHPDGNYKGEQDWLEVQAQVEANYRVKPPADVEVAY